MCQCQLARNLLYSIAIFSILIVRPYVSGEINFSPYCLGVRLIAKFEGNRMGMGMPFSIFEIMIRGIEESMTGFPFTQYHGASA